MRKICLTIAPILLSACFAAAEDSNYWKPAPDAIEVPGRWPAEKALAWYAKQPWLVGCNYIPANAINQLEMWQAETFDPKTIDKELQMAEDLGFNTLRVFLHDLVWAQDPAGLYGRMDQFLNICARHGIKPVFVFFDDCHWPAPKLGPQPLPVPGFHNSGWVTSPAFDTALKFSEGTLSEEGVRQLKGYVQETMRRFKDDSRVLMWELYNEPGRRGKQLDGSEFFGDRSAKLVYQAWVWAREVNPSQPVCSCADGSVGDLNIEIAKRNSDINSFHVYVNAEKLEETCKAYAEQGRPALCTEYLARTRDSTFENNLPVLKKYNIGAFNWGFVSGKTGTVWPWSSRKGRNPDDLRAQGLVLKPGDAFPEPEVWFHDIYRVDGSPYKQSEIAFIKQFTREQRQKDSSVRDGNLRSKALSPQDGRGLNAVK